MADLLGEIVQFGFENWFIILLIFLVFTMFIIFKIRNMNNFVST